jgi:t-SNARE complex subunit (syntaxin)
MQQSDFERFQQGIFDELDELERQDVRRSVDNFVELGRRFRIDVVAEILDKGKTASEVFDTIRQEQSKS